jgi:uncharacterized membrane protein YfcA
VPGIGEVLIAAAIILTAATISGLTGFGFGLVSAPPLLLLFDPALVVAIIKVLTLGTTWIVLVDARRHLQRRTVLGLLPWAIGGLAVGVAILKQVDPISIKLLASAVVILFALLLLRGITPGGATGWWTVPLTGLTSGALSTSTGLSGPPIVLLFTLRRFEIHAFRASAAAFFILTELVGLPALLSQGVVGRWDIATAAVLAPAAVTGRFAGIWLSRRVSRAHFYRITLFLLILTGAAGVISAVLELV